jgi:hypothetical protein
MSVATNLRSRPLRPLRLCGFLVLLALPTLGVFSAEPVETPAACKTELASLAERFAIPIEWKSLEFPIRTQHGMITGEAANANQVAAYVPLLTTELNLYPPGFVAKTKLKRITLCRELSFGGQRRTAVPDFEHDVLYLDVARESKKPLYLTEVFHHEFFHIVDLRDDGKLYADERWAKLNRDDFAYGTGGKNAQDFSDTSLLTDKYPGFLNHYSTTGVEEDKAELFANLIVEPEYVARQAAKDAVLQAKIECLKDELRSFCDDVDNDFWKRVDQWERHEKSSVE